MSDKKVILDLSTNEVTERDLTPQELTDRQNDAIEYQRYEEIVKAKAAARADILKKLGLTQEEVAVLLG